MKIERRKTRTAEVYTASLTDIMFFLLLFFLIISTMVTPAAIKVLLPKASTAENVVTKKNINLVITADLQYFIENAPVGFNEIEPFLASIIRNTPQEKEINILLQADKSLNLQHFVDIIEIGNKLHLKVVLFTKKE